MSWGKSSEIPASPYEKCLKLLEILLLEHNKNLFLVILLKIVSQWAHMNLGSLLKVNLNNIRLKFEVA